MNLFSLVMLMYITVKGNLSHTPKKLDSTTIIRTADVVVLGFETTENCP